MMYHHIVDLPFTFYCVPFEGDCCMLLNYKINKNILKKKEMSTFRGTAQVECFGDEVRVT